MRASNAGTKSREASVATRQLYTRQKWPERPFRAPPNLFVVLRILYDTRRQRRERRKFLRNAFQQRRRLLGPPSPIVNRNLVGRSRRRAFPQRDTGISTVFAQDV